MLQRILTVFGESTRQRPQEDQVAISVRRCAGGCGRALSVGHLRAAGHRDTFRALLRRGSPLPPGRPLIVPVGPDARILVHVHVPASARGTLLIVHGLGGSAASWYVLETSAAALARGWAVLRMNCRTCGGTEGLSRTLFDATQSGDLGEVLQAAHRCGLPGPLGAVGFSLGGALLLRYAGQTGHRCPLARLVAVNPPLDLDCAARALEFGVGRVYGLYFTVALCRLLERVRRARGEPWPPARWWRLRTVRRFDARYVAPAAGFPSAEAYYAAASPGRELGRIVRPTLILAPRNDPIVPCGAGLPRRRRAGAVRWLHPDRGGHLGYPRGRDKPFWPALAALRFLERARRA